MGNPVVHFEIIGADLSKLQSFYGALFDWRLESTLDMGYTVVGARTDHGIDGGIGASDEPRKRGVYFYVEVDDPQAYLDRATSLGATVLVPVTELPMVTFALFADPDGNPIGLVKA